MSNSYRRHQPLPVCFLTASQGHIPRMHRGSTAALPCVLRMGILPYRRPRHLATAPSVYLSCGRPILHAARQDKTTAACEKRWGGLERIYAEGRGSHPWIYGSQRRNVLRSRARRESPAAGLPLVCTITPMAFFSVSCPPSQCP